MKSINLLDHITLPWSSVTLYFIIVCTLQCILAKICITITYTTELNWMSTVQTQYNQFDHSPFTCLMSVIFSWWSMMRMNYFIISFLPCLLCTEDAPKKIQCKIGASEIDDGGRFSNCYKNIIKLHTYVCTYIKVDTYII